LRRKSSTSIPASEITRDWGLLQQVLGEEAVPSGRDGQVNTGRWGRMAEASNASRQTGNLR
jgi:hypothetical protein